MLSSRCQHRNEAIIPRLLSQHNAVLMGDLATIDLSTAENWPVKQKVLEELRDVPDRLVESVSPWKGLSIGNGCVAENIL